MKQANNSPSSSLDLWTELFCVTWSEPCFLYCQFFFLPPKLSASKMLKLCTQCTDKVFIQIQNQPACQLKLIAYFFLYQASKSTVEDNCWRSPGHEKKEYRWESSHLHKLLLCYTWKISHDFIYQKVCEEGTTARNHKCLCCGVQTGCFHFPVCSVNCSAEDSAWQSCSRT